MNGPSFVPNKGKDSELYQRMIENTLGQLNATNQMIGAVKAQADEHEAAGDMEKYQANEHLVMHLDLKAMLQLNVIASYEGAKQQAIANEYYEANSRRILTLR